jgi:hypothetical protein
MSRSLAKRQVLGPRHRSAGRVGKALLSDFELNAVVHRESRSLRARHRVARRWL